MGESDGGMSSVRAQLSAECSTSTASGREAEALDVGGGVDADGSRVERCIVSMLPCVAREVAGLGEVAGLQRLSVVVWSMGCNETEAGALPSRGDASGMLSSLRSGGEDEEGVYGLPERKGGAGAVLPWSCGTAGGKTVEAGSSWTLLVESG